MIGNLRGPRSRATQWLLATSSNRSRSRPCRHSTVFNAACVDASAPHNSTAFLARDSPVYSICRVSSGEFASGGNNKAARAYSEPWLL